MPALLSTDLNEEGAVPYFLWDQPMTVRELRHRLGNASPPERARLLGKVLREARESDVWRFTTPTEIVGFWDVVSCHLGRRRAFWEYLIERWRRDGLLDGK